LAIAGLVLWQVTQVGDLAIIFALASDGLAGVPTLVKSFKFPETESAWPWLTISANGLITLLTIRAWDFAHFGFPLYFAAANLIVFVLVQFKLGKSRLFGFKALGAEKT